MKNVLKSVALAAVVVAATSSNVALAAKAAPAAAPASSGGVNGVAVADLDAVLGNSAALKAAKLTWNEETLDKWLTGPMQMVPGTMMSFPGLKDPAKRAELIAWLKTQR